ncbi:ArsR/SmtB family transcription factor [Arthrobacter sp. USHLN218]|uniref:ArsR/SmtB family transcription factor n=1 Tax=Arthrobacter sp. USHLN218 TaxID=3081232 RepID=UPI003018CF8E
MVIDDVFAVIAETTRREILAALRDGDKAVGELVDELEVSQPTVSKHLKVLREAGLVSMRAQGQKRYYGLQPGPLQDVADWVGSFGLGAAPAPAAEPLPPAVALVPEPAVAMAPAAEGEAAGAAPLGRSFGQAANQAAKQAADLLAHLPKLRRGRRT